MGKIVLKWLKYWTKRKKLFVVLLLSMVSIEAYFIQFLDPKQDISDTLPKTEEFENYSKLLDHKGLNSTLFLSVTPKTDISLDSLKMVGEEFEKNLYDQCEGKIKNVSYQSATDEMALYEFIDSSIPWLIESEDYQLIEDKIQRD